MLVAATVPHNSAKRCKTAVNSVKTELSNQVESFQADFAAADARNQEWQFNNRAATVATLTVAGVTAAGGLLDRTYKNTEAINDGVGGIRNNIREGFEDMKDKFKKIGSMIDIPLTDWDLRNGSGRI
ncbi:MAG TPA: hypothetical protein DDW76_17510 [Cyanobacteria bacterium UBA11369]|nr:hypothetical protein [Cyanobacteria bacterium UBA11371]HBE50541.1 hypothetical protein [Cyanobacteria bacterium UBA11369]